PQGAARRDSRSRNLLRGGREWRDPPIARLRAGRRPGHLGEPARAEPAAPRRDEPAHRALVPGGPGDERGAQRPVERRSRHRDQSRGERRAGRRVRRQRAHRRGRDPTALHAPGVCPLTARQKEGAMWIGEHSIETSARPEHVWRLWADVEGWPQWNGDIERIELRGSFATGGRIMMTPPGQETIELRIAEVIEPVLFVDEASVDDVVIRTTHR